MISNIIQSENLDNFENVSMILCNLGMDRFPCT